MRAKYLAVAAAALLATSAVRADVVVETNPYQGTPDWTDIVFSGSEMAQLDNGDTRLTTGSGGIWFGWGCCYSDPAPAWAPGNNATGNLVRLNAYFSSGSPDWSLYLGDGFGYADMNFNPTVGCDGNARSCRDDPYTPGVEFYFGSEVPGGDPIRQFVALDTTVNHDYGFLLKDGLVSYFIDGHTYSGLSMRTTSQILVIGDGSGSTQTGWGSMFVHSVSFDNAPRANVILGVPEPASWAMTLLGFGAMGAMLRTRKRALRPA